MEREREGSRNENGSEQHRNYLFLVKNYENALKYYAQTIDFKAK